MTAPRPIPANIELQYGAHRDGENAYCAMELVAYVAGEPHTDRPACACPVIGAYVRVINDHMDDATRQQLVPYVERIVGTRSTPEVELRRALIATDVAVRDAFPAAIDAAGIADHAATIRRLDPITGVWSAREAVDALARVIAPVSRRTEMIARMAYQAVNAAYADEFGSEPPVMYPDPEGTPATTAAHLAAIAIGHAAGGYPSSGIWSMAIDGLDRMIAINDHAVDGGDDRNG